MLPSPNINPFKFLVFSRPSLPIVLEKASGFGNPVRAGPAGGTVAGRSNPMGPGGALPTGISSITTRDGNRNRAPAPWAAGVGEATGRSVATTEMRDGDRAGGPMSIASRWQGGRPPERSQLSRHPSPERGHAGHEPSVRSSGGSPMPSRCLRWLITWTTAAAPKSSVRTSARWSHSSRPNG